MLSDDDLEIAARRYGHERDRSIWLFEELYLQNNERLRPLLNHQPFTPFARSWQALRRDLDAN